MTADISLRRKLAQDTATARRERMPRLSRERLGRKMSREQKAYLADVRRFVRETTKELAEQAAGSFVQPLGVMASTGAPGAVLQAGSFVITEIPSTELDRLSAVTDTEGVELSRGVTRLKAAEAVWRMAIRGIRTLKDAQDFTLLRPECARAVIAAQVLKEAGTRVAKSKDLKLGARLKLNRETAFSSDAGKRLIIMKPCLELSWRRGRLELWLANLKLPEFSDTYQFAYDGVQALQPRKKGR